VRVGVSDGISGGISVVAIGGSTVFVLVFVGGTGVSDGTGVSVGGGTSVNVNVIVRVGVTNRVRVTVGVNVMVGVNVIVGVKVTGVGVKAGVLVCVIVGVEEGVAVCETKSRLPQRVTRPRQ